MSIVYDLLGPVAKWGLTLLSRRSLPQTTDRLTLPGLEAPQPGGASQHCQKKRHRDPRCCSTLPSGQLEWTRHPPSSRFRIHAHSRPPHVATLKLVNPCQGERLCVARHPS